MVERAGMGDIDALVQLRLAYLRQDRGALEAGETQALERALPGYFREHLNRDLLAFVIREEERIVSCALLLVVCKPMSPAFINGRTGVVLNVTTVPAFRRRGYAGEVMRALLCEAKKLELCTVELKATRQGYSLYRSLGFTDEEDAYRPMWWEDLKAHRLQEEGDQL